MRKPFLILLIFITSLHGYTQLDSTSFGSEDIKCSYCIGGKHHHTGSPYNITFKTELPYFLTSAGLLGSGLILRANSNFSDFTEEELNALDRSKINSFDRSAAFNKSTAALTASDIILYGSLTLPLYFLSNHHTKKDIIPLVIMGTEIFSITSTLALNSKFIANRTRPLTYNPEFSLEKRKARTNKLSFFSGHTAQSSSLFVFAAKVINDYHPNMRKGHKIALWTIALGAPMYTGYLRVKGGKHFTSDVIAGYFVGSLVGWLVPHLHKKNSNISLTSFNQDEFNGLSLSIKLN